MRQAVSHFASKMSLDTLNLLNISLAPCALCGFFFAVVQFILSEHHANVDSFAVFTDARKCWRHHNSISHKSISHSSRTSQRRICIIFFARGQSDSTLYPTSSYLDVARFLCGRCRHYYVVVENTDVYIYIILE